MAAKTLPQLASVHCSGTWQDYSAEGPRVTNISRFYDACPEPKYHTEGVGLRFGKAGLLIGGFSGAGAQERADDAADYFITKPAKRRMITAHSRGYVVACRTLNELRRRGEADRSHTGKLPPWATIDCMILFDPVLSVGLSGMFKTIGAWIDYLLPGRPLATWIGIEAKRTLPWNCNAGLAIYALNELRPGYRQTLINGPNATRIWIEGVHGDGGGYRNPELGVWAGQIARQYAETVLGPTVLRRVRWPEGWVTPFEYVAKPAAPTIRIPYKGDEAWFRVLDSLESGSDPDFNSE